jgi:small-conductance mechanosensitive channel
MLVSRAWLRSSSARAELADPASFFIRVLFAGLGIMILLDNLGVSLTAVWTSLGIGSIAVALALQDTLSNFFAGVYLRLDRPVKMGDYIKIEGKEEGYVDHLGWRSTWIKTRDNTVVVVPNAKLSSSILTNYSMPSPQLDCTVRFSVGYDADLERVETIVVEEAKAVAGNLPGLLADPAPYVELIPGFGAYALNLQLNFTVSNYEGQYPAQHELRKRILARFRQEGIAIPFPQRDVHVYRGRNQSDLVSEFVGSRPISKSA